MKNDQIDSQFLDESQSSWPSMPKPSGMSEEIGNIFDMNSSGLFQDELTNFDLFLEPKKTRKETHGNRKKERQQAKQIESGNMRSSIGIEGDFEENQEASEEAMEILRKTNEKESMKTGKKRGLVVSDLAYESSPKEEAQIDQIAGLGKKERELDEESEENVEIDLDRLLFDGVPDSSKTPKDKGNRTRVYPNSIANEAFLEKSQASLNNGCFRPTEASREFSCFQSTNKTISETFQELDLFTVSFKAIRNTKELQFFSNPFIVSSLCNDIPQKMERAKGRKIKEKKETRKRSKAQKRKKEKKQVSQDSNDHKGTLRSVKEPQESIIEEIAHETTSSVSHNEVALSTEKETSRDQRSFNEASKSQEHAALANSQKAQPRDISSYFSNQRNCKGNPELSTESLEEKLLLELNSEKPKGKENWPNFPVPLNQHSEKSNRNNQREICPEDIRRHFQSEISGAKEREKREIEMELEMVKKENEMLRKTTKSQANKLELYLETFKELKIQAVNQIQTEFSHFHTDCQ